MLLLTDVFEKFSSSRGSGLCLSRYLSAPNLSWFSMLNMAKCKLELFQMLTCICYLKGRRNGVFYIYKRYRKANNKYLKSYD